MDERSTNPENRSRRRVARGPSIRLVYAMTNPLIKFVLFVLSVLANMKRFWLLDVMRLRFDSVGYRSWKVITELAKWYAETVDYL